LEKIMLSLAFAYVVLVVVLSAVSFVVYAWDKWRARRAGYRVPEKTLQLLALCGGWPGALLGQRVLRHKTRKTRFQIVFWLCVIGHLIVVSLIAYLTVRSGLTGSGS
tara:strand:+ start:194 stop:514 length:321 start_codon:yes stop_codon:yes gene_type:complete